MTVVAYRNGVMASDSWLTSPTRIIGNCEKLYRSRNNAILGLAGESTNCNLIRDWFIDGPDWKQLPKINSEYTFEGIIVLADGTVIDLDCGIALDPVAAPFFACGCGGPVAMGAMEMGATAAEAVAAACKWVMLCGGPTQLLRLHP